MHFSRPYIYLKTMLDQHLQTKKKLEISNEDLKKKQQSSGHPISLTQISGVQSAC